MMHSVGYGFFVRLGLAVGTAALFVVTVVWPDWIEIVFRVDPDRGNGWLEWVVVFVAFGLTLIFSIGARREWRRLTSASAVCGVARRGVPARGVAAVPGNLRPCR